MLIYICLCNYNRSGDPVTFGVRSGINPCKVRNFFFSLTILDKSIGLWLMVPAGYPEQYCV